MNYSVAAPVYPLPGKIVAVCASEEAAHAVGRLYGTLWKDWTLCFHLPSFYGQYRQDDWVWFDQEDGT